MPNWISENLKHPLTGAPFTLLSQSNGNLQLAYICTGCPAAAHDAGEDGPTWTHVPKNWRKKEACERIAIRLNHIVQHDDDEDDPSMPSRYSPSRKRNKRSSESDNDDVEYDEYEDVDDESAVDSDSSVDCDSSAAAVGASSGASSGASAAAASGASAAASGASAAAASGASAATSNHKLNGGLDEDAALEAALSLSLSTPTASVTQVRDTVCLPCFLC
jgi:hypothetical protein